MKYEPIPEMSAEDVEAAIGGISLTSCFSPFCLHDCTG
jgi:hypothetical protein